MDNTSKSSFSHKRLLERYHSAVHDLFARYGSFVATHPLPPLLIGLLLLGSLCIGIIKAQKESSIERLWVETNSRVVPEKRFYDSRFGGISRKESAAITMKGYPNENLSDLGQAMDALTSIIQPLYDQLTWNFSRMDQSNVELSESDFCERPLVPKSLRSGGDPNIYGNWYAWGYRFVSKCALDTIGPFLQTNLSRYHLPDDWGIDILPCYKLTPMDCFQEGNTFDYPLALQQLEQLVIINSTLNATLNQLVAGFEKLSSNLCFNQFKSKLSSDPQSIGVTVNLSVEKTTNILNGVKELVSAFAAWGYNWRPSYKNMTNEEILTYINEAIDFSKNASINLSNPAAQYCITEHRPCCLTWFGATTPVEASLGSVNYNVSGKITAIGSLRWGANNWNENHPLWIEYIAQRLNTSLADDQRKSMVVSWENRMIENLIPSYANEGGTNFSSGANFEDFQVQFTMWKSAEDMLQDANNVPIWQISLSAVLVFAYAFLCFVDIRHPVHSHTTIVLMGLVVVALAIAAGFGLTSAFSIKLSPLAGSVVPFLALGLGIDDVFVLVNMMRIYTSGGKLNPLYTSDVVLPKDEMKLVVSHTGPSVILTTFSVLASFFVSSLTPIPMVRWFCWQMGITALIHTLGMLLIFIPLMSIDARRVKAGVNDPLLWILYGWRKRVGDVMENNGTSEASSKHEGRTLITSLVAKYYAPLFKYNSFKIVWMFLFATILGTCIYLGFWKVKEGIKFSDIARKGSYQHGFAKLTEESYPQYDLYLVTRNIQDYSTVQTQLIEVYDRPQNNLSKFLDSSSKIFDYTWLGNLYASTNLTLNLGYPFPPENFTNLAKAWSTSPLGLFSLQDLYCQDSSSAQQISCFAEEKPAGWSIGATKTVVFASSLGSSTKNNVDMIQETRRSLDEMNDLYFNGKKVLYLYGYPYLFYEQYLQSSRDLYMVVGLALVGVFIAVFIFQFSLIISFVIVILLLMVDIEVYGLMYLIGAKLNALSLVNLGIVIGMASEFTYLARSFLICEGKRAERVQKALELTFEPLLHGLGTQVVAMVPLLFLKFHAFRVYYFGMFTIMGAIGFLNGFVLLPIILSWIGPPTLEHMKEQRQF